MKGVVHKQRSLTNSLSNNEAAELQPLLLYNGRDGWSCQNLFSGILNILCGQLLLRICDLHISLPSTQIQLDLQAANLPLLTTGCVCVSTQYWLNTGCCKSGMEINEGNCLELQILIRYQKLCKSVLRSLECYPLVILLQTHQIHHIETYICYSKIY